ncbi:MAG: hypothetical protein ABF651_00195 [Sporolactobacillus sp.]
MAQYDYLIALIDQPVEIQLADGTLQYGIVDSVDQENVYLKTLDPNSAESQNSEMRDDRFFGPGAFLGGFAGGLLGVGLGNIIGVRPWGPGPWGPSPGPWGPCGPGPCGPGPWGPGPWGPRPW